MIFYILLILVLIVVWYVISKKFCNIAELKGYNGQDYFWWVFLCGIFGVLMVIALPAQTSAKSQPQHDLKKAGQMREQGIITEEEFQKIKAEYLAQL